MLNVWAFSRVGCAWSKEIVFPEKCPVCGSDLKKVEGEVDWRCVNNSCPARVREELLHWSARGVMNIDGLGDAMVAQLLGPVAPAPVLPVEQAGRLMLEDGAPDAPRSRSSYLA